MLICIALDKAHQVLVVCGVGWQTLRVATNPHCEPCCQVVALQVFEAVHAYRFVISHKEVCLTMHAYQYCAA